MTARSRRPPVSHIDRPFFFWVLVSLVVASVGVGVIVALMALAAVLLE